MRIIIETDNSDNVSLNSQGEAEIKSLETEQADAFVDAGAPSDELLMALDEASAVDFELDEEEGGVEDDVEESIVH